MDHSLQPCHTHQAKIQHQQTTTLRSHYRLGCICLMAPTKHPPLSQLHHTQTQQTAHPAIPEPQVLSHPTQNLAPETHHCQQELRHPTTPRHTPTQGTSTSHHQQHIAQLHDMGQHSPRHSSTLPMLTIPYTQPSGHPTLRPRCSHTGHSLSPPQSTTLQALQWTQHSLPNTGTIHRASHRHLLQVAETSRHAHTEHPISHQQITHLPSPAMASAQTAPHTPHPLSGNWSLSTEKSYHTTLRHPPCRPWDSQA